MRLEEIVNKKYDILTSNDKEMINMIFKEKSSVKKMTSIQLAAFLHVSRTTLVRLIKKLGISTYAEFKLLLNRTENAKQEQRFDMQTVVNDYHTVIEELKKCNYENICKLIHDAKTVYLYGTGNEQKTIAEEFKRIFLILGKCCIDLFDLGEVQSVSERFQDNDIFIVISLSGENQEAVKVVRIVQEIGIKTVSFTRWDNNTLARSCHDNLYVGTRMVQQTHMHSYEMVTAFYIMLDILSVRYLEYITKFKEKSDGN